VFRDNLKGHPVMRSRRTSLAGSDAPVAYIECRKLEA
jgi:hypothetical protein